MRPALRTAGRCAGVARLLVGARQRARRPHRRGLAARQRGLPARRLRGRGRRLRGARPRRAWLSARSRTSTSATPTSARARSGPRSGRSSARWRSTPTDEDARYNLDQARKLAARRAQRPHRRRGDASRPGSALVTAAGVRRRRRWLFVALYVGLFVGADRAARACATTCGRRWARSRRCSPSGALLAGALLVGRARLDRIPFGVVLPDAVAVKEGADANYRTSFDVHAGLRVRVVDRDQDWLRVRLANGLEGWVRAQEIGRICRTGAGYKEQRWASRISKACVHLHEPARSQQPQGELRGEGERGGARRVQAPPARARRQGAHARQRRRLPGPVRARRHRRRLSRAGLVRRGQGRGRARDRRGATCSAAFPSSACA